VVFKNLKLGQQNAPAAPTPLELTMSALTSSAEQPIALRSLNALPETIKRRIYRGLLPETLLARFAIDPVTWRGPAGDDLVRLEADEGKPKVSIAAFSPSDTHDPFLQIEISDNAYNSIDLDLIVLSDPDAQRFGTDRDEAEQPTQFGTLRRNLPEEAKALAAGLAPGQIRAGLRGAGGILQRVESYLAILGHRALYLEPLTYTSAWVFERNGFAYTRGHQLMDTIHTEFQPGGRLHQWLDGSTPFRSQDAWKTVRGRAWAIQDGALAAIEANWENFRMVKQLGRHANVQTFPEAEY
jgi:hypothetical protein